MADKRIVKKEPTAPLSPEQIELVKDTVAKGATDDELKLFLYTAGRTGLDPLTHQIHFVKRRQWNPQTKSMNETRSIQTGIDGYRVIADRTGTLDGIDDAVFDTETEKNPNKASVTVYRFVNGHRVAFTATARWDEYAAIKTDDRGVKSPVAMWAKMPYLMLAKCAEALALRKAFPNDLSGLYTAEEMQQADNEPKEPVRAEMRVAGPSGVEVTEKRLRITQLMRELGVDLVGMAPSEARGEIVRLSHVNPDEAHFDRVIEELERAVSRKEAEGAAAEHETHPNEDEQDEDEDIHF